MPYTITNYPNDIKDLPIEAKRIWINAFNSAFKLYKGSESMAFKIAWTAVKNVYYKNDKDIWVKKKK